jgi:hypothetical protein
MIKRKHRFDVITNERMPHAGGFGSREVLAIVVVLCVAVLLAVSRWTPSGQAAAEAEGVSHPPQIGDASLPFEYFPAQYVNQAKEPEEHIQAF